MLTIEGPQYHSLLAQIRHRNRHGNIEVIATNDLGSNLTTIVMCKRGRQCRVDQALVRHVAFVLIAFIIFQHLRLHPKETLGEVKDRIQLKLITHGLPPPSPLRGKVSVSLICNHI